MARFTGKSVDLLSFDEVADKLKVTGRVARGRQSIPVTAVVGSVGRYNDFTRTFLPRQESDKERWARLRASVRHVSELPPIEVYQIGEAYFVSDGNHRVSLARLQGADFIDAYVTEVYTKVPLSPGDHPDELIIKAEYAAFLERWHLDQLRPGCDLTVSVPGQYGHLENHIEVHRYLLEEAEERTLTDAEAAARWYDEAYLPVVEATRERGILRDFPGRTEADFYLWIAIHRAQLQNELQRPITPSRAVTELAAGFEPQRQSWVSRLTGRLRRAKPAPAAKADEPSAWSQQHLLERYSQHLFAEMLVLLTADSDAWPQLTQALAVAAREQGTVTGLYVGTAAGDAVREAFTQRCQTADVPGRFMPETGDAAAKICQHAPLSDLVVVGRAPAGDAGVDPLLASVVPCCKRPLLVVPQEPRPPARLLLAYDDSPKAHEALFAAAYLAEQWGVGLAVLTVQERDQTAVPPVESVSRYLEMHEVTATFLTERGAAGERIVATAVAHDSDLIILGGSRTGRAGRPRIGATVDHVLRHSLRPVLLCP